jgi:hypothetical protein
VVATAEELKYDIANAALFEQGQQFVDVRDYQRLVVENNEFRERISILENEVRMIKEARASTLFENEDVQEDQQMVNFMNEVEVGTSAGDAGNNTPPYDDPNAVENLAKSTSNMATRIKKKPRKRGRKPRLNL